jgi:hypothetical protein
MGSRFGLPTTCTVTSPNWVFTVNSWFEKRILSLRPYVIRNTNTKTLVIHLIIMAAFKIYLFFEWRKRLILLSFSVFVNDDLDVGHNEENTIFKWTKISLFVNKIKSHKMGSKSKNELNNEWALTKSIFENSQSRSQEFTKPCNPSFGFTNDTNRTKHKSTSIKVEREGIMLRNATLSQWQQSRCPC